jgi:hypothetical protein
MMTHEVIAELEEWLVLADIKVSPTYRLDEEEHKRFLVFREKHGHKFRTFLDLVKLYIKFLQSGEFN